MIFIDGSNMYHSLKAYFKRTDIDLGCFSDKILDKRRLVRMYYYNAVVGKVEEPERFKDQEKFFKSVAAIPYTELRLGRLVYTNQWPNSPPFEKGVDVQLATDMITHAFKNNYDVAILVAGDNDFVGAIQAVKDNGKHVEVALFGLERTSRQLRDVADRVIALDGRILRGCWKGPPTPRPNVPRNANRGLVRRDVPNGQRNEPRNEGRIEPRHEPRNEPRNEPRDEALSESNPEPYNDTWNDARFEA
jgi:uncharacterized LabA/DUF88 family protein